MSNYPFLLLKKQLKLSTLQFDFLAGTSTGALISLGLADNLSLEDLDYIYRTNGSKIFTRSIWHKLYGLFGLSSSAYNYEPLKKILDETFGELRLGHLQRKVLIGTFDLDNEGYNGDRSWKPKFFHNWKTTHGKQNLDLIDKVADVALYSAAAPVYFSAYNGFIDGGVVTSNPSMAALAKAVKEGHSLKEIKLFSLGTGFSSQYIEGSPSWGMLQWIKPLVNILLDGTTSYSDYQCRQFLGSNYHYLDFKLPKNIAMDDVSGVNELIFSGFMDSIDLSESLNFIKENILNV